MIYGSCQIWDVRSPVGRSTSLKVTKGSQLSSIRKTLLYRIALFLMIISSTCAIMRKFQRISAPSAPGSNTATIPKVFPAKAPQQSFHLLVEAVQNQVEADVPVTNLVVTVEPQSDDFVVDYLTYNFLGFWV